MPTSLFHCIFSAVLQWHCAAQPRIPQIEISHFASFIAPPPPPSNTKKTTFTPRVWAPLIIRRKHRPFSFCLVTSLQYHTHFSPLTSHPVSHYKQALCQCGYYRLVSSARLPLAPRVFRSRRRAPRQRAREEKPLQYFVLANAASFYFHVRAQSKRRRWGSCNNN